jgi:predicted  nucleic acid-binding Zn-ribbon protein
VSATTIVDQGELEAAEQALSNVNEAQRAFAELSRRLRQLEPELVVAAQRRASGRPETRHERRERERLQTKADALFAQAGNEQAKLKRASEVLAVVVEGAAASGAPPELVDQARATLGEALLLASAPLPNRSKGASDG